MDYCQSRGCNDILLLYSHPFLRGILLNIKKYCEVLYGQDVEIVVLLQGPVGVGYTCYCAPFFKNVEDKLEKDKVALMDHIDAAHDKLDAKITNLEHRTKSHIQHLSDNVKQKVI